MRSPMYVLLMCLSLTAAGRAAAQDAVFPVEGTNLNEGELAAIGSLITSAYAAQSGRSVLGPNDVATSLARTQSERDTAQELGLSEYIHVSAVRLTSRITLEARRVNRHGSVLFEVRTTALSLDDMEPVAERLAAALWRRTELKHTRTLDNVTGKETRANNRLFVEKLFGARFAVVAPVGYNLDVVPSLLLQFDARLEQEDYFIELAVGMLVPNEQENKRTIAGMLGHIGASYYLTHTFISPYIGAGLSPRIVLDQYTGVGLAAGAHVGLMFMRSSSTRIYAELQIDQNLIPLSPASRYEYDYNTNTGSYGTDGRKKVLPTELSLAVGIGF